MPHIRDKIPKRKFLVGHGHKGDYYKSPSGEWLYSGQSKEDWENPKYWRWLGK